MSEETVPRRIGDLPHAPEDGDPVYAKPNGQEAAVFLDHDGTLTPIVDSPEDAMTRWFGRSDPKGGG